MLMESERESDPKALASAGAVAVEVTGPSEVAGEGEKGERREKEGSPRPQEERGGEDGQGGAQVVAARPVDPLAYAHEIIDPATRGDFVVVGSVSHGDFLQLDLVHKRTGLVLTEVVRLVKLPRGLGVGEATAVALRVAEEYCDWEHRQDASPHIVTCFKTFIDWGGTSTGVYVNIGKYIRPDSSGVVEAHLWLEHLGKTVSQALEEGAGPAPPAELHRWTAQVALALEHLHARGRAAGDVRPSSVYLTDARNAKLLVKGSLRKACSRASAGEGGDGNGDGAGAGAGRNSWTRASLQRDSQGEEHESEATAMGDDLFLLGLFVLTTCTNTTAALQRQTTTVLVALIDDGMVVAGALRQTTIAGFSDDDVARIAEFLLSGSAASVLVASLLGSNAAERWTARHCLEFLAQGDPDDFVRPHSAPNSGAVDRGLVNGGGEGDGGECGEALSPEAEALKQRYSPPFAVKLADPPGTKRPLLGQVLAIALAITAISLVIVGIVQNTGSSGDDENDANSDSDSDSDTEFSPGVVAGLLTLAFTLAPCFTALAGTFSIAALSTTPHAIFFLVYVADIVLAFVLARSFSDKDETTLTGLAYLYAVCKIVAWFTPYTYMRVSRKLVKSLVECVRLRLFREFGTVWRLVGVVVLFQVALLYLGMLYFTKPATLGQLVLMYPFVWLLNVFRYVAHFACVRVYVSDFMGFRSSRPVLSAVREAWSQFALGLTVVSLLSVISPMCTFSVTLATTVQFVGAALAFCGASGQEDGSCVCIGVSLMAAGRFLEKVMKTLLTFVTKYNLTTMVVLEVNYLAAIHKTHLNKQRSKAWFGSASIVTQNITSLHITNICLMFAALVYLVVDAVEPVAAFYCFISTYVVCRTLFEPVDAWIMVGYCLWDYKPALLHPMCHSSELRQQFEQATKGDDDEEAVVIDEGAGDDCVPTSSAPQVEAAPVADKV